MLENEGMKIRERIILERACIYEHQHVYVCVREAGVIGESRLETGEVERE